MLLNILFHILLKHHIAFPHFPASFNLTHGILKLFNQCISIISFASSQISLNKIKQCYQFLRYFLTIFSICVKENSAVPIAKYISCFFTVSADGIAAFFLPQWIKVTNKNDICICQFSITFPFFQHFHIHLTVVITAAFFQTVFFYQLHLNVIMCPIFIFCKYIHANAFAFWIKKEAMLRTDLNSFNPDLQYTFQKTSAVFCIHHNSRKHKIVMKYQFFQCFFTHFSSSVIQRNPILVDYHISSVYATKFPHPNHSYVNITLKLKLPKRFF